MHILKDMLGKPATSHFAIRTTAMALPFAVLTACGGGGTPAPDPNGDFFSALSSGSVARALDDGKVIAAKHGSAVQINWDTNETMASNGDFSVRKTADGHLAFTANVVEHVLTAADLDGDGGYATEDGVNNDWVYLHSYDGPITEDFDPSDNGFVQVYIWYTDVDANGSAQNVISVIGTETDPAQMDLLTIATYGGWMNLEFFPGTGYGRYDSRVGVRGDMEMTADFAGSTISGSSVPGELLLREGGNPEAGLDDVFTYDAAMIDDNSYGGTIGVDADFLTSTGVGDVTGTYEGSFYGAFADETDGTISGTTAGDYNLIGQFNADWRN